MKKKSFLVLSILLIISYKLLADVKLPKLISDWMILQRDIQIPIWGWAPEGEEVLVKFMGKSYKAVSGSGNKWAMKLDKASAGGPYIMEIKGNNTINLKDILIGDVWICSGQSNMAFKMDRIKDIYADDVAKSSNSKIRHFEVAATYNFKGEQQDIKGSSGWKEANPKNVLQFSAAAYFFAKDIYEKYKIPVGLIHSSKGGTPAESWMSEEGLKQFPNHYEALQKLKDDDYVQQINDREKRLANNWNKTLDVNDKGLTKDNEWYKISNNTADWKEMKLPDYWQNQGNKDLYGAVWFQKKVVLSKEVAGKTGVLSLGNIDEEDITYVNGIKVGNTKSKHTTRLYKIPAGILIEGENNVIVRVIARNSTGGFIKDKPYHIQIESKKIDLAGNWKYKIGAAEKPLPKPVKLEQKPAGLYNCMIAPIIDYGIKGVIWYQGEANASRAKEYSKLFQALIKDWRYRKNEEFPFLFVQLASFKKVVDEPSESGWAALRDAQLKTLRLPKTGMAVAIDIGEWNDIHPLNKKDVGKRLALAAMRVAYGDNQVVSSGPIYQSMQVKGNKMELSFANVGGGLISKDGKPLKYFALAAEKGKYVWANAKIEGNKVVVWSDNIPNPIAVRYAWADNPEGVNFYNKEGLPASSFGELVKK